MLITSGYERRLASALEVLEKTKSEIDFLKLQIKEEKKQTRWAKGSPIIKDMVKRYPGLRIDNGAGLTYLGLDVQCTETFNAPFGWECFETRRIDDSLGSPVLSIYKLRNCPAHLYVTKHIR